MKRRMAQPLFVLSVAVTLVLTLSVVVLSAQFQPIVPDIGFEIEGNTALDQGGVFDWENADYESAERISDPNSMIDDDETVFKPKGKFDDPAGWSITTGRVGPGQSELINFLVWGIQPGDLGGGRPNDHWLVLGMERIKTPGFFELDFEYNQAGWDGSSGGLTRTPGDVLVGFELRGKPTSRMAEYKVLLLQYWPDAQPSLCSTTPGPGGEPELVEVGTDPCPLYSGGWYYRLLADDALSAESGLVQATMNKEPFAPSWPSVDGSGQPCDVIGPYQFAEAAINLTALGIEPECSNPGTVHAKSRSAPHVRSDLKDLVGPVPVVLECAARLDGHKFEDVDGDGVWDSDELPLEGWEIKLNDGSVTHTNAEGYYAFEDLDYDTYTVNEVCPQGEEWVQTMPPPDDPDSCGEAVYEVELSSCNPEAKDLDFGNHRVEARLDGHKFLDIDGDGLWGADEPPLEGWEIRLMDGSVTHTDADGYYAFEDLDYGTYTVSEVCPPVGGWYQTAPVPSDPYECDGVYTVELNIDTPEVNDLDFGNSRTTFDLQVSKNAQTSFTRTHSWNLTKEVDNPGPILLHLGEYADVVYTVEADSEYVDSEWAVEGTITILNTGPDAPLASVSDVISPGDKVPVDCGWGAVEGGGVLGFILGQGETLTCTYGPEPLPDGSKRTNTVAVTVVDSAQEFTSSAGIDFAEATIEEIDEAATVTDTNSEDEQWEGPAWFDIGAGETPWDNAYPWRFHSTGELCRLFEYPNTATLVTNDTGTTKTAQANVQIREACQGEVTIAYEDLRIIAENDWDYNDLVVHIPISLTVSDDGNLEAVRLEVTQEPVSTAFTHAFNVRPYVDFCTCSGTYTKKVTVNGGPPTVTTDSYNPGDDFLLIPDTRAAGNYAEFLVEWRIDFDEPEPGESCPPNFEFPDLYTQYHGEWLFFDPWITVYRPDLTYEINAIRPPGDAEPRILTVPFDWTAPIDYRPIWLDYPCVKEGIPPVFSPYWWDNSICTLPE